MFLVWWLNITFWRLNQQGTVKLHSWYEWFPTDDQVTKCRPAQSHSDVCPIEKLSLLICCRVYCLLFWSNHLTWRDVTESTSGQNIASIPQHRQPRLSRVAFFWLRLTHTSRQLTHCYTKRYLDQRYGKIFRDIRGYMWFHVICVWVHEIGYNSGLSHPVLTHYYHKMEVKNIFYF